MNIEDIIEIGKEWDVKIKNHPKKDDIERKIKGRCSPDKKTIQINKPNIDNLHDYNITLVHEFMHAIYPEMSESGAEFLSIYYVNDKPEYPRLIKDLFDLPYDITKFYKKEK